MSNYTSDIAFTPSVKAQQERFGSRETYARMEEGRGWATDIDPDFAALMMSFLNKYVK